MVAASFGANLLSLALPMAMIHIYDRVIPNRGYETLVALGLMVVGAIIAEAILRAARRHILDLAAERFERAAYPAAVNALLQSDPAREARFSQGHLYSCISGIERLRSMHVGSAALDPLDLPFALLFLAVIALLSPVLGASVFVLLAFAFLVLRVARRSVLIHQTRRRNNEERRHSFLSEVLRGLDFVKTLRIEDFMLRRYERLLANAASISGDTARAIQLAQGFTATIGTLTPLFVAAIGALMVIKGEISVGSLAAIVLLTGRIIQPVLRVEAYLAGSDNLRQTQTDLAKILSMPPRIDGLTKLRKVEELTLSDISTLPDAVLGTAFVGLDLTIRRGECVAVTGSDRQVQSLFLRLLAGEIALVRGSLLINGWPDTDYALADRHSRIKLLSPDNALMEGSLIENLTAFQPKLFRDRAIALAQNIGIDAAISKSADGYGLRVGPNARTGLPKSLTDSVAIVRGLVSDPDVILFDEANGALDRDADARLLQILRKRQSECLIVLVSNRPSYLRLASRTFDLKDFVHETREREHAR